MVLRTASKRKKPEVDKELVDRYYHIARLCFLASFTILAIIVSFIISMSGTDGLVLTSSGKTQVMFIIILIAGSIVSSTIALLKEPIERERIESYVIIALAFDIVTLIFIVIILVSYLFTIPTY